MGLIRNELLSLDLIPTPIATSSSCYVPKSITDFLRDVSSMDDFDGKVSKFDEFINSLTEEMKKVDAFKRELPLCIVLLHDAVNYLRKECEVVCKPRNVKPVLEEFIPIKKDGEGDEILLSSQTKDNNLNNNRDKKNWMRSFQLWNTSDVNSSNELPNSPKENGLKQESNSTQRDRGGGHDFKLLKEFPPFAIPFRDARRKENKERPVVDTLSFLDPRVKNLWEKSGSNGPDGSCNRALSTASPSIQSSFRIGTPQPHLQTSRKQRRCWSPDLHRRFVNALQQLGGSQVATPKQIRDLMQVDGLTNDEVKSHLQKYRLHTKRTPGSQPATSGNQCGESSKNSSNSLSASPEGPHQLPGNTRGTLTTGDDSTEDEEDDKSETYSWKSNIHNPGTDDA